MLFIIPEKTGFGLVTVSYLYGDVTLNQGQGFFKRTGLSMNEGVILRRADP
jgi:hypothetical protein